MYEEQLKQIALFDNLDRKDLRLLAKTCTERDFPAGAELMKEGSPAAGLFILVEGRVRITHSGDSGLHDHEITTLGAGAVVGEMALLDNLPRSATVTAIEPTRCLLLPVWHFQATLRESPEIAIRLLAQLSKRLRSAQHQLYVR